MINDLDSSIEQLLKLEIGDPLPFNLSFSIPDKKFSPVSSDKNTLDCYLYDIRENRELREVDPVVQRRSDGLVTHEYPPARVQLSYCITAWSPASPEAPAIDATKDEHKLLSDVLRVFLKYPTLPPVALVGSLTGQQPPLPTTVILPDGTKTVNDFWTAIGGALRPSLDYKVTISMEFQNIVTGPMVTTQISRYTQYDSAGSPEESIQIGGQVLDSANPSNPIPNAWVRLDTTGETQISDAAGRFVFSNVIRGQHALQVRAVGYQDSTRIIQVPEPTGNYNVPMTA